MGMNEHITHGCGCRSASIHVCVCTYMCRKVYMCGFVPVIMSVSVSMHTGILVCAYLCVYT